MDNVPDDLFNNWLIPWGRLGLFPVYGTRTAAARTTGNLPQSYRYIKYVMFQCLPTVRPAIREYLLIMPNFAGETSHIIGYSLGSGIAQLLERRTRDWKVAGSNPCRSGGIIFFSDVNFLCWLLFRYPFHPRVTAVARKRSRSFCQKCRWQVTAKHAYTLRMWILLNRASALVSTCP